MKRLLSIVFVLLLMVTFSYAEEEKVGVAIGVEFSPGNILEEYDPGFSSFAGIAYNGLALDISWAMPYQNFNIGELEIIESYSFDVGLIGLSFGNDNVIGLAEPGITGYVFAGAGFGIFSVELQASYLPSFAFDTLFAIGHSIVVDEHNSIDLALEFTVEWVPAPIRSIGLEPLIAYTYQF